MLMLINWQDNIPVSWTEHQSFYYYETYKPSVPADVYCSSGDRSDVYF